MFHGSRRAIRSVYAGLIGLALTAFAFHPAMADFIGNTDSGGLPTAFTPLTVPASDFPSGPAGDAVTVGPETLIFQNLNTYDSSFSLRIQVNVTGAFFQDKPTVSIAGQNLDGTIGDFTDLADNQVAKLNTVFFAFVVPADTFSFMKLSGLDFINAGALQTAGNSINLAITVSDEFNQIVYETFPSTAVVISTDVPAPGALLLLGSGLVGLAARRRTRARA